jgi:hypothetical protein
VRCDGNEERTSVDEEECEVTGGEEESPPRDKEEETDLVPVRVVGVVVVTASQRMVQWAICCVVR